ncbi:MAG: hypothetical protein AABZ00_06065 [Chloroflexota bacterium]
MKLIKTLWIVSVLLLTSCMPSIMDMTRQLPDREIYRLPSSDNSDLTWITSSMMIVKDFNTETKLWSFDTGTKNLYPIKISTDCTKLFVRSLQRLPDQKAGFILDCPKTKSQIIHEISVNSDHSLEIYVEASITWLGNFAYSQDKKELMLVEENGVGLASSLYYQSNAGDRINITPDFQRADYPVWSPTENAVAFVGTKLIPDSNDDTKTWGETKNLFDYPWKVYIYDIDDSFIKELPVEIIHPGRFKWSPNGRWLGFTGKYKGIPGVWIIDLETDFKVIRVVDQIASFDFSPDGNSIAYIGNSSVEGYDAIKVVELMTDKFP